MTEAIRAKFAEMAFLTPEYIAFIRAHLEDAHTYYTELLQGITKKNFEERFEQGVFAAYYTAAENHWIEMYPDMVRILRIPVDMSDPGYFSDYLTEFMQSILYHVYNGDPQPLVDLVQDARADEFARNAALCALAQLYIDGVVPRLVLEGAVRSFYLAQIRAKGELISLPSIICGLDLNNLRYLIDQSIKSGLWDEEVLGSPDEFLNEAEYNLDYEIAVRAWLCLEDGLSYQYRNRPTKAQERACFEAQRARLATYLPAGTKLTPREGP